MTSLEVDLKLRILVWEVKEAPREEQIKCGETRRREPSKGGGPGKARALIWLTCVKDEPVHCVENILKVE